MPGPGLLVSGDDGSRAWFDELVLLAQDPEDGFSKIHTRLATTPIPTLQQTEACAEHVAGNHSWYKHLPSFPPGVWFLFAPNPNAGCQFVWWENPKRYRDLTNGAYFDHHSRLSTAEYRKRFGFWDYTNLHPSIQDSGFWPATLPIHSKSRFTSFLQPHLVLCAFVTPRFREDLRLFEEYAERFPADSDVLRYRTLKAITGRDDLEASLMSDSFKSFLREEGGIQRSRLRDTLLALREEWIHALGRSPTGET